MNLLIFVVFLYFFFDFIIQNEKEERGRNGTYRNKKHTVKTTIQYK